MEIKEQTGGFKVTKVYFSPTFKQQFSNRVFNKTSGAAMHCVGHVNFSKDPKRKIVSLRMDWGFKVTGYIDFFADDNYYVFYDSYEGEDEQIDKLIAQSKKRFIKSFNEKSPTKIIVDLNDFHGKNKDELLRKEILKDIHKRD